MKDIFSDYIGNLHGKAAAGGGSSVSLGSTGGVGALPSEQASLELLREISGKLDRLAVSPASPLPPRSVPEAGLSHALQTADLAIINGLVVLPDNGVFPMNVYIKDGKISHLGTGSGVGAARTIDATGKYVLPGIIDPHVHLGLFAPLEEELQTETRSALLSGITTIGCYLGGAESHLTGFPAIEQKVNRLSHTDVIPHLVIGNEQQKQELSECAQRFGITSFKVYMNGIPGMIPDVDDGFILDVFQEMKRTGKKCILCSHAENRDIVRRAGDLVRREKGERATVQDWTDTHPDMAEEEAVIRLSYLAQRCGTEVYFVHISSKAAIQRLREIKARNPLVHIETTSPYLSVTKNTMGGNAIKMEPPFREAEDVEELWQALEDGVIDTVGTDNVTQTKVQKNGDGSVWDAMPGYPALGTHLPVLLTEGVVKRGIPIEKLVTHLTKGPAETFGVYPQKGTLLPGSDADLVVVDLSGEKSVCPQQLLSRSDFSLYEGRTLRGWPLFTVKGGQVVVENGQYVETAGRGKCLKR